MSLFDYLVLAFLLYFCYCVYRQSWKFRFRDVIASSYKEADFYYGKQGSEFSYGENGVWQQVVKRDGWKCYKCGRRVYPEAETKFKIFGFTFKNNKRKIQVDHRYIPYVYGGQGVIENSGVICHICNIRKGAKITREALLMLRKWGKKIYLGKKVPKFEYKRRRI